MGATAYTPRAQELACDFRSLGYASSNSEPDRHVTSDYVTVRVPGERYPFETIYIDADGYTFGDRFEHVKQTAAETVKIVAAKRSSTGDAEL